MEGHGHGMALWLMADVPGAARLTAIVTALASRLATPVFVPHVTLIHGLAREESEIVARAGALARRLASQRVDLLPAEGREEFFRCLYLPVEPAEPLRAEHRRAAEASGVPPDPEYLPHLSLVYGRLDADERDRIAVSLAGELPTAIELVALEVWRTVGPVGDWTLRRRYALAASRSSRARRKEGGSMAG